MRLPECLDDWVDERNPIRMIDAFVDALESRRATVRVVRTLVT
jgi:hypothetical protein